MKTIIDSALDVYLDSYRGLIETERDGRSVIMSFPLHLAANHRIEVTVTDFGKDMCIISDSGRTLGEVQAAGYSLAAKTMERLQHLVSASGLRIVDTHLVLESSYANLGPSIQKFLEMSKTIGDVYLVHSRREAPDDNLLTQVQTVLDREKMLYRANEKIAGEIESHDFDIVVPPNGVPGLALAILNGKNTHSVAQIWGFKCEDIRRGDWHKKMHSRVAVVYDVRYQQWSDASRAILESRADIAVASDNLAGLSESVHALKSKKSAGDEIRTRK